VIYQYIFKSTDQKVKFTVSTS